MLQWHISTYQGGRGGGEGGRGNKTSGSAHLTLKGGQCYSWGERGFQPGVGACLHPA